MSKNNRKRKLPGRQRVGIKALKARLASDTTLPIKVKYLTHTQPDDRFNTTAFVSKDTAAILSLVGEAVIVEIESDAGIKCNVYRWVNPQNKKQYEILIKAVSERNKPKL